MPDTVTPLVRGGTIRIAMLGMVEGNGHPYSWSAIFNGYDSEAMESCPFPVIPVYLGQQPAEAFGIGSAQVTHIWTDDPSDARHVAKCSLIPNVVADPTDVIGAVDAVVVATDIGSEHVDRCRPFVEAGIPVFIDKPMVDASADLATFVAWHLEGRPILSCSAMRYSKELIPLRLSTCELGLVRYVNATTPKSWERYGIHALEGVYPILGPGYESVRNSGSIERNIVHLKHSSGADVVVAAIADMYGAFGMLSVCGTVGSVQLVQRDTFYAFRTQLVEFVRWLQTGCPPFPFDETVELMKLVIAGTVSRNEGGREVSLSEFG